MKCKLVCHLVTIERITEAQFILQDLDLSVKCLSQVKYQSQLELLRQMFQTIQVMIHSHQNLHLHLSTSSKLNLREEWEAPIYNLGDTDDQILLENGLVPGDKIILDAKSTTSTTTSNVDFSILLEDSLQPSGYDYDTAYLILTHLILDL